MYFDWQDLLGFLTPICFCLGSIFLFVIIVCYIAYFNNKAGVIIYLNGVEIYSGMDRNTEWKQLGENGNSYQLKIFKEGFWNSFFGNIKEVYVGRKLEVKKK